MKLKQLTLTAVLFAAMNATWADDMDAFVTSEEVQELASISDATAAMPMELAANETDTVEVPAEPTTTEAAPADDAAVAQQISEICEAAAKEEGVAEEAMDEFMANCTAENGGALESAGGMSEADVQSEEQIAGTEDAVAETTEVITTEAPEATAEEMAGTEEYIEGEIQPVSDTGDGMEQGDFAMTGNEVETIQQ